MILVILFLKKLRFTPCQTEQPLRDMELLEKKDANDIRKLFRKCSKKNGV